MSFDHIHIDAAWRNDERADLDIWCGWCAWRHTWEAPGDSNDGSATLAELLALAEAHACLPGATP